MSKEIQRFNLQRDLLDLLDLPPPETGVLSSASEADMWVAVKNFRSLWLELLQTKALLQPDGDASLSPAQFSRLMLTIGGTYNYAFHRLITFEGRRDNQTIAGFSLPMLGSLTDKADEIIDGLDTDEVPPNESLQLSCLYLTHEYGTYLLAAEVLSMPVTWALSPAFVYWFDHQLLNSLLRILGRQGSFNSEVDDLASRLVRSGLTQATQIAADRRSGANADHKPGSFSLVRPQELGPIAAREQAMIRRHGEKALESIFEQQIALVFQSFGFLVIPTQKGKRSADLLCLSNDSPVNRLIMIEAKTTKGFYSLPSKDERALREYVETVRTSLRTLPEPSLLLLVAPRGASTLEAKLDTLSDAIRIPIRFIRAETLAGLREAAPGAIPSDLLVDSLMSEPTIVKDEFPQKLETRLDELQQVHRRLAQDLEAVWTKDSNQD